MIELKQKYNYNNMLSLVIRVCHRFINWYQQTLYIIYEWGSWRGMVWYTKYMSSTHKVSYKQYYGTIEKKKFFFKKVW